MFGKSIHKTHLNNGYEYVKVPGDDQSDVELVFLHGMFGGLSNYDPLLEQLSGYTIYVPSIPVYDFDTKDLTIPKLGQWLYGFCKQMNIQSPVLVGNSMGGHIALEYAVQYPEMISSLVLTGSSGLLERDFGSTCPRRNDREYIRKQAALTFYDDLIDDTILDEIIDVITTPAKLTNLLAITRSTHQHNMEEQLPEIAHPVLLIWGRNDEITPPGVAESFHRLLPEAQLKWIDKCGHAPMMEHPQTFALYLNQFIDELKDKSQTSVQTNYEENRSYI